MLNSQSQDEASRYEQARLIIELSNWADGYGTYEAIEWVYSEKYDDALNRLDQITTANQEYRHFSRAAGFHETTALFWKHGALGSGMLFDWLDFVPLWKRLEPMVKWDRVRQNNAELWSGFESIANRQIELQSSNDMAS